MNALDVQDIILEAQANVQEFLRDFYEGWNAEHLRQRLLLFWSTIPAEYKERFEKERPADYETITRFLRRSL